MTDPTASSTGPKRAKVISDMGPVPDRPEGTVRDEIFRPILSGNIFEETVERVLGAIRLGDIGPGEQLPTERDLAAALGVSRATLREANRALERAGYLEVRRGRGGGTFVVDRPGEDPAKGDPAKLAQLRTTDVEDVLAFRMILEVNGAEIAALTLPDEEAVRPLRAALQASLDCPPSAYRPTDSRLHREIAELAGVPSLTAAIADSRRQVNDLLDAIPLLPMNIEHSNQQHIAIVDAIVAGNSKEAQKTMYEHLVGTGTLLRAFLA